MTKKKIIFAVIFILVATGALAFWRRLALTPTSPRSISTYFTYTAEEISSLKAFESNAEIQAKDIYEWDGRVFDLISRESLVTGFDANTAKIYAYLAVAEHDAAALSFNAKQRFAGSVSQVAKEIICIFFQNECSKIASTVKGDAYSEALAKIVIAKIKTHIAEDKAKQKPYPVKTGKEYWDGPEPRVGFADGYGKTWFIASGDQFRVPKPPAFNSPEFKAELAETQKALKNVTDKQRLAVVFWAGGPGTMTTPGIWLKIADDYMQGQNVNLEKLLKTRLALTLAIVDTVTAVFDSKYTYWVRRPFMMDKSIITIMPTPNHPSYPAGHSGVSAAAAVVLSHYLPENSSFWQERSEEGGMSRVWGGIHYPMDHKASKALGEAVAGEALKYLQSHGL